jgi:hypothetical protein
MQKQIEAMRTDHQRLTHSMATASKEQAQALQGALHASQQQQNELMKQIMEIKSRPARVISGGKRSVCFY